MKGASSGKWECPFIFVLVLKAVIQNEALEKAHTVLQHRLRFRHKKTGTITHFRANQFWNITKWTRNLGENLSSEENRVWTNTW